MHSAAGFNISRRSYDKFRRRFNDLASDQLSSEDFQESIRIDGWTDLDEVNHNLLEMLMKLRPFGPGNPTPVFAARNVKVVGEPKVVGSSHLKMVVARNGCERSAIGFDMADRQVRRGAIDVAFRCRDTYGWRNIIQLNVKDFRPSR